jgi:hypothetical protein
MRIFNLLRLIVVKDTGFSNNFYLPVSFMPVKIREMILLEKSRVSSDSLARVGFENSI